MSDVQYSVETENDYYISINVDTKLGIFNPFRLGKWSSFVYDFSNDKHYKFENGSTINILDTSIDGKYVAYNILQSGGRRSLFKIVSIEYNETLFSISDDMEVLEAYFTKDIRHILLRAKVYNAISIFVYDIISNEIVYTLPVKTFILDGFFKNNRSEYSFFSNDKNVIVNTLSLSDFSTSQVVIDHIDSPIKKIYCHYNGILLLVDSFNKVFRYEKNNRLVYTIETLSYMPKYQGFLMHAAGTKLPNDIKPDDARRVYFDTPLFYYDAKKNSMESILYYFNINDGQVKSKPIGSRGGIFKKFTPIDDKTLIDSSGKIFDLKTNETRDFLLKKYI